MKRTNVKGNTWILEGPQLVGLYQIDEKTCLLFDPGSTKLRPGIEAALQEAGLTPVGVVCTHMHYDHHETTRYFRDTYGAQTCLPQLEADIVRCEQSLKNHLFNFTMGMVRTIPRLQNLICPVDRVDGHRLLRGAPGHPPHPRPCPGPHLHRHPGQRLLRRGRPHDRGRAGGGHGPLRL